MTTKEEKHFQDKLNNPQRTREQFLKDNIKAHASLWDLSLKHKNFTKAQEYEDKMNKYKLELIKLQNESI